jgi:hypothetical protein
MNAWLFCAVSSNEKRNADPTASSSSRSTYANLLKQFSVLDKDSWPVELSPGYGEDEVRHMCQRFDLPAAITINAFRDFVDDIGRRQPADLKPLLNCMQVIPCSTADDLVVEVVPAYVQLQHIRSKLYRANYDIEWIRKRCFTSMIIRQNQGLGINPLSSRQSGLIS